MRMLNFDDYAVLTFDCYGTLIDWESGIWQALDPLLVRHNINVTTNQVLELYGEFESKAERGEYRAYKTVLRMALAGLASRLGFVPTERELSQFSDSVKDWPAFADTTPALHALRKKYQLAIISNIDDDLFAYSAQRLQVKFDWIITAQQAKSYKPSLANFQLAFRRIGLPQNKILHVAQSLYHDIVPANALGLSTVWVNRRHDKEGTGATPPADAKPDVLVPDLRTLVEMIGLH
jgi:2-haloacid dehalogenase